MIAPLHVINKLHLAVREWATKIFVLSLNEEETGCHKFDKQ